MDNVFYAEELVNKVGGGMFSLIRVAQARALEIHTGKPPLIKFNILEKETSIALREIMLGKVVIKKKETKK